MGRILMLAVLVFLGTHVTLCCSCVSDSLPKRFRDANAVFVGKVANFVSSAADDEIEDLSLVQNVQNEDKYSQTLEVLKDFKGTKKKFVSLTFDEESLKKAGMCPTLYHFEDSKEYLVFAYGNNLEVKTVCSDTWVIPSDKESFGYDQMQDYLGKLGSFWFRFRSRLHLLR